MRRGLLPPLTDIPAVHGNTDAQLAGIIDDGPGHATNGVGVGLGVHMRSEGHPALRGRTEPQQRTPVEPLGPT